MLVDPSSSLPGLGYDFLSPVLNLLTFAVVLPWAIVFPLWLLSTFFIVLPPRALRWIRAKMKGQSLPDGRMSEGVWTIHGRQYDLTAFADSHPGGPWALQLGRNRDCTGLFESYHIFSDMDKLRKIMARFELPESKSKATNQKPEDNPTGLIFGDAFHEDVKSMAKNFFKEKGVSPKMKPWVFTSSIILIIAEVIFAVMILYGYRIGLVLMPLCGWLLTGNVSHEASHWAVSSKPWVNRLMAATSAPLSFNSTTWFIEHIVQHHVYTNDEPDVDLYHFLPIARTTRLTKYVPQFAYQWLAIAMALPTTVCHLLFVVPLDLLTGHIDPITGKKRYSQCENVEDLVAGAKNEILLEFLLSWIFPFAVFCCHGFVRGYCWLAILYSISSGLFILFTQGAHLNEDAQTTTAQADRDSVEKSWAKRQISTAVNFEPESLFWSVASGGLNIQAIHHLLPTISASHLREMWPRFREVCNKHDVELKECNGIWTFLTGFLGWIASLSKEDSLLDNKKAKAS